VSRILSVAASVPCFNTGRFNTGKWPVFIGKDLVIYPSDLQLPSFVGFPTKAGTVSQMPRDLLKNRSVCVAFAVGSWRFQPGTVIAE